MATNPYQPVATQSTQLEAVTIPLNWRAIFVSIAICFGVGCLVGIGWGMMAVLLALAIGPSITTFVDNPILLVAGFIVGLVPTIIGALYLGRQIESRQFVHATIYSTANLLISALFMLIPSETGTSWTDICYCALLIPVSIACVSCAARIR